MPEAPSTGPPIDQVYNLIRGCNPAPGAWTTLNGAKLQIFDCRKFPFRRFADVKGAIGEIAEVGEHSFKITAHGGHIEVLRARSWRRQEAAGSANWRAPPRSRPASSWAADRS